MFTEIIPIYTENHVTHFGSNAELLIGKADVTYSYDLGFKGVVLVNFIVSVGHSVQFFFHCLLIEQRLCVYTCIKSKAVPLHAMEALGRIGCIAPTHS